MKCIEQGAVYAGGLKVIKKVIVSHLRHRYWNVSKILLIYIITYLKWFYYVLGKRIVTIEIY